MVDVSSEVESFYGRLGRLLRERRIQKGVTQQGLAFHLGLSRTSVVNIEKGRQHPAVHQLAHAADYLGCSFADLVPSFKEDYVLSETLRHKAPDDKALDFLTEIGAEAQRGR